ncbi:ATP-binding protein [Rathayibacter sp. VKM Ac-2760]|uniref:ATP-binding protein n=1 Tax=Rathayibacter sp. VKM Ac-2760 TaxID=2609253 RepID=UPI001319335E|nr:ATP-binding protein [Rathayibacter sp. VKM Ac-2760]QHC57192.1 hypothetical protein GSU72_00320 [Rathayibacter sp. VKM Ac-2760]
MAGDARAPSGPAGESEAASRVLRWIAIQVSLVYTVVVALDGIVRDAPATVVCAVLTAVVIVLAHWLWSPAWLCVVALAALATWWTSATAPLSPSADGLVDLLEPGRPLAVGTALTVVALGLARLRSALLASAAVTVIALTGAALLGAPAPRLIAAGLWSINVIAVCALGGWGMRRGAVLAAEALARVAAARRDRAYGEELARRRREHDITVHDNVLATLTMLGHGGVGIDPHDLRERCRDDLVDFADDRPAPVVDPRVDDLIVGWRRLASTLRQTLDVRSSTDLADRLEPGPSLALDGAVRESLRNVGRHAGTDAVEIRLEAAAGHLVVEVVDAGRGFDPQGVEPLRLGIARSIVRRIEAVGGRARVRSVRGEGTSVRIELPVAVESRAETTPPPRVPASVPAAERLRRTSRTAPTVIGWVGVLDAALMVAVFWQDYLVPAVAGGCIAVLLATGVLVGRPTPSRGRFARGATVAAFLVLVIAVTVAATLTTPASIRFTGANIGVTGVSLALVWFYRSQPSAHVLLLAGAHTSALIALALLLGAADPQQPWALAALVARLGAEAMVTPVGVAIYLRSAGRAVVGLNGLDREVARVESTRAAEDAAEDAVADRRRRLRELAAPLLEDVATGRAALPLTSEASAEAAGVARAVRSLLSSGPDVGWLALALGAQTAAGPRQSAEVTVLDGEGAADDIPDHARTPLLEVIGCLSALAARRSAALAVVATRYGDSVGIVLTAGPGALRERDASSGALTEALGRLGVPASEVGGFIVVEAVWERFR